MGQTAVFCDLSDTRRTVCARRPLPRANDLQIIVCLFQMMQKESTKIF